MQTLTIVIAVVYGLCFGSFATVITYRIPRGESVVKPPSHCTSCKTRLRVYDLIPVVSWLFLRGRCRYCRERISIRYPAAELICGVLFGMTAGYTGLQFSLMPLSILAFLLLCISIIDAAAHEISDSLVCVGFGVGILWVLGSHFTELGAPVWYDALLGVAAGAVPLFIVDTLTLLIVKKDGFGYGDIKLMGMAGLYLGWHLTLSALFYAVVMGGAYGAYLLIMRRVERGAYLAFGPFLAIGIGLALWIGAVI